MARIVNFAEYVQELKHLTANEIPNEQGIQPHFIQLALCGVGEDEEFILVSPDANATQPEHIQQWRDYDSILGFTYSLPYAIDLNLDGIPREGDTLLKSLHIPLPGYIEQNLVRARSSICCLLDLDFPHICTLGESSLRWSTCRPKYGICSF